MDGHEESRTTLPAKVSFPTGLSVDSLTERLYWIDSVPNKRNSIKSVDYDGNNLQEYDLIYEMHPLGLAHFSTLDFVAFLK